MPHTALDPSLRERLTTIQKAVQEALPRIDPHRHLAGRPVSYDVIGGRTLEITFRDVPRVDEAEILAVKKLVSSACVCSIAPQTAETLTVRFVVPLRS